MYLLIWIIFTHLVFQSLVEAKEKKKADRSPILFPIYLYQNKIF